MLNNILSHNNLSRNEYERYAKQIIIEEIKIEGQSRLKKAKVICIGAGGINSSTLMYLAACGIGTLGVIDDDNIELSNLQRQVIYRHKDIGKKKVKAVRKSLFLLNESIKIKSYNTKLTKDNIINILSNYEIVIDGTDNFAARYLISEYCYRLHKIHVYGAIDQFTSQVSVFNYQNSKSYYSLYNKMSYSKLQRCDSTGVINTLPGLTGLLQATETIKIILGLGKVCCHELLVFNMLKCSLAQIKIKPCKLLNQKIKKYKNRNTEFQKQYILTDIVLSNTKESDLLIDIRTSEESKIHKLNKAINIPLHRLKKQQAIKQIKKLAEKHNIILYCGHSTRSYIASQILQRYSIKHYIFNNQIKGKRGIRTLVK